MVTVLHVAIRILVAYPILSLMEYLIHRVLKHKRAVARIFRNKYFADTFREHAIVHHVRCYAVLIARRVHVPRSTLRYIR